MKVSTGFMARLNKHDDDEVSRLMLKYPLWKKTYARRIVAARKFTRMMDLLQTGQITREQGEQFLRGNGHVDEKGEYHA